VRFAALGLVLAAASPAAASSALQGIHTITVSVLSGGGQDPGFEQSYKSRIETRLRQSGLGIKTRDANDANLTLFTELDCERVGTTETCTFLFDLRLTRDPTQTALPTLLFESGPTLIRTSGHGDARGKFQYLVDRTLDDLIDLLQKANPKQ
jgi:hypothetical protein